MTRTTWLPADNGGWWRIVSYYYGRMYCGTIQTWHRHRLDGDEGED